MHPYHPRPIRFHGVRTPAGWRLKLYSITHDARTADWPRFDAGLEMATDTLPRPAQAEGRAGVGFLIAHQGRNADYLVLGWWDRENELPVRVFIREGEAGWRAARGGESFCVRDLQVLWAEREAYVQTVLAPDSADRTGVGAADAVDAYLARFLEVGAGAEAGAVAASVSG